MRNILFNPSDIKDMLDLLGYVWSGKYSRFYPKYVYPKNVSTQDNLDAKTEVYFKADKSLLLSFNRKELRDLTIERIDAIYHDYDRPDEYLLHVYNKNNGGAEEIVPFYIEEFKFVKAKFAEYSYCNDYEIEKAENYDKIWNQLLKEKHPLEYCTAKIQWNNFDIKQLEERDILYNAELTKWTKKLDEDTRMLNILKEENEQLAEFLKEKKEVVIEKEI